MRELNDRKEVNTRPIDPSETNKNTKYIPGDPNNPPPAAGAAPKRPPAGCASPPAVPFLPAM